MSKVIGQVVAVAGVSLMIEVDSNLSDLYVRYEGKTYTVGQPGTYLVAGGGHDKHLVLVTTVRKNLGAHTFEALKHNGTDLIELPKGNFPYLPSVEQLIDRTLIEGVIVGTIIGKKFEVGVSNLPVVGERVTLAMDEHLKIALSPPEKRHTISIGSFVDSSLPVYFDLDNLLGKHTAIVGTTGCGKSYTVARLLQEIIKKYPSANIVVFDLHGEYRSCFDPCRYIRADKLKLPAWLHSFEDLFSLCADLSNQFNIHNQRWAFRDGILKLKQLYCRNIIKDTKLADNIDLDSPIPFNFTHFLHYLHNLNTATEDKKTGTPAYKKGQEHNPLTEKIEYKPYVPYGKEVSRTSLYGELDRLILRVQSRINDPRYAFMFQYDYPGEDLKGKIKEISGFLDIGASKPVTVFDLSYLPSETVGAVVATISRILFQTHFLSERRKYIPSLVVYEEAHNYISRHGKGAYGEARTSVERIAKEGRKFGIGALVISQRPSELSETLLSQCNSFLCMRLANSQDRAYVEALLPDSMTRLIDILPALPRGHIMALGLATKMPVRIEVQEISDEERWPNSDDPPFGDQWSAPFEKRSVPNVSAICDYWIRSKKPEGE
ncbi:MAG TPA: ATP-binding protein [Desulfobulbaceae bacterium]|nr:ATP-binding protein [Desulfobulbaceae bacterium]